MTLSADISVIIRIVYSDQAVYFTPLFVGVCFLAHFKLEKWLRNNPLVKFCGTNVIVHAIIGD